MDENTEEIEGDQWKPNVDLIVRTILKNFVADPGTLFTCSIVCEPWSKIAVELIKNVPPLIWKEKAQLRYSWATEGVSSPKGGWGEWMKSFRTHFNDKKDGWVQLNTKGNNWKLLWMNTQSTGLMLYREYKENRYCFINLERGLEIKKVEKKGKQNCATISTLEQSYTFSCVRDLDRESWIEMTQEIIQFYNPRHKEMVNQLKNAEIEQGEKNTISRLVGKKIIKKIGTGFRSTKLYGTAPVLDGVTEDPQPTSPKATPNKPATVTPPPKDKKPVRRNVPDKYARIKRNSKLLEELASPEDENIEEEPVTVAPVSESPKEEVIAQEDPVTGDFSLESAFTPEDSKHPDVSYKVIIIGNTGVGKSNLLDRWLKEKFTPTSVTISADLASKNFLIEGKHVKVNFWDTAGQESHFALTQSYFRQTHGAIVVYDITSADTFFDVQKWVNAVKDIPGNENTQFLLIGNKVDLEEQRDVTTKMGLQFAKKLGLNFMETSAFSGSNVNRAFQIILQDIHRIAQTLEEENSENIVNLGGKTVEIQNSERKEENSCCPL